MTSHIDVQADERRTKARPATHMAGRVRRAGGSRESVMLLDLSPGGCRLGQTELRPGEKLWITIGTLNPIEAEVRWAAAGTAGLQFAAPLYPAVADHLVRGAQGARTAIRPALPGESGPLLRPGARAGWIAELRDAYRR